MMRRSIIDGGGERPAKVERKNKRYHSFLSHHVLVAIYGRRGNYTLRC